VKVAAEATWNFIASLPEKIGGLGGRLVDVITWPFRTSFNMVADFWNRTIGGIGFSVPDWVPGMGGKGFNFPKMPRLHTGGVVPGVPGTEVPILALAGETVGRPAAGGGGTTTIQLVVDGRVLTEVVHNGLLAKQRRTPLGLAS
jgi:hypothetical protein